MFRQVIRKHVLRDWLLMTSPLFDPLVSRQWRIQVEARGAIAPKFAVLLKLRDLCKCCVSVLLTFYKGSPVSPP